MITYKDVCKKNKCKTLRGAVLTAGNFSMGSFVGGNFERADLSFANFFHADLRDAYFSGANLRFSGLCGADITGSDFTNARLDKARLVLANISDSVLRDASFYECDLSGANFYACVIDGANFSKARYSPMQLLACDWRGISESAVVECMLFDMHNLARGKSQFKIWKKTGGRKCPFDDGGLRSIIFSENVNYITSKFFSRKPKTCLQLLKTLAREKNVTL